MQLYSIAGGAPPGGEAVLNCCFMFVLLPLVVLLAGLAVYRNAVWPGVVALVFAGLPFLSLLGMVAGYEPSDDWEVVDEQVMGCKLVWSYLGLVAVSGLSLAYVWFRRRLSSVRGR